jgi:hypothetical protein
MCRPWLAHRYRQFLIFKELLMTNFVHCRGCGVQIHETAVSCPKCGAPQAMAAPVAPLSAPLATPTATAIAGASMPPTASAVPNAYQAVNPQHVDMTATLPQKWQDIFALIDKAGGANLPNKQLLTAAEIKQVESPSWSMFAPNLFYLLKGLWKKAISITLMWFLLLVVVGGVYEAMHIYRQSMTVSLFIFLVLYYVLCAKKVSLDYYRKVKFGLNPWW